MPKATRKLKKTFSLSRESILYLESVRKRKKRESISSVLEDLIRQQQQTAEMTRISASVTDYYDSLTEEERTENRAWGEFALSQFPTED
jgi:NAD dependent epimerase/dehydratase family enzyme